MRVRLIARDELPGFEPLGEDDFVFVAEAHDGVAARVAYTGPEAAESTLYGLVLPWEGDYVHVGRELLSRSLGELGRVGVDVVETRVNPSFHPFAPERERVLRAVGFELVQDKLRLVGDVAGAPPPRLSFQSRRELGREMFVDAVRRVTRGTLDRVDALEVARLGEHVQAELYTRGLESEGVEEDEWLAAYDGETFAGLVVLGAWDDETGLLAYVGVDPPVRGRGIVAELVAEARRRLGRRGYAHVLADVDSTNTPMLAALERVGLRATAELRVYWARPRDVSN